MSRSRKRRTKRVSERRSRKRRTKRISRRRSRYPRRPTDFGKRRYGVIRMVGFPLPTRDTVPPRSDDLFPVEPAPVDVRQLFETNLTHIVLSYLELALKRISEDTSSSISAYGTETQHIARHLQTEFASGSGLGNVWNNPAKLKEYITPLIECVQTANQLTGCLQVINWLTCCLQTRNKMAGCLQANNVWSWKRFC